jgi:hypothetical protein
MWKFFLNVLRLGIDFLHHDSEIIVAFEPWSHSVWTGHRSYSAPAGPSPAGDGVTLLHPPRAQVPWQRLRSGWGDQGSPGRAAGAAGETAAATIDDWVSTGGPRFDRLG